MAKFIYVLIATLFLINPGPYQYLPMPFAARFVVDLLAMGACVAMALRLVLVNNIQLNAKYAYLIFFFLIVAFMGVALHSVRLEPMIAGMRSHLKYLPFFLLPAVFKVSEEQLRKYLMLIFLFCLVQLPAILMQKLVLFRGAHPDFFGGTLAVSTHVSLILVGALAILFAFYLNGKIRTPHFLFLGFWLFLGTTLNETKGTIFYLPLALAFPAYFFPRIWGSARIKNLCTMAIVGLVFITSFALIFQKTEGYGIFESYQRELQGGGYLYYGDQAKLGERVGRVDIILSAFRYLSNGVMESGFGLGMGNVIATTSAVTMGGYVNEKAAYRGGTMAFTHIFWELGFAGIIIYLLLFYFLFRDSLFLRKSGTIFGTFALGWTGLVPMMVLSLIHTNFLYYNALNVLFWFFSGMVAAKACELRAMSRAYAQRRDYLDAFPETVHEGTRIPPKII